MHRLKYAIPRATTCFTFYAQGKYTFHTRKFMINVNELHLWILVEATWKLLLWKFNVEEFTSSFQVSYIFANALHVLCVCVCEPFSAHAFSWTMGKTFRMSSTHIYSYQTQFSLSLIHLSHNLLAFLSIHSLQCFAYACFVKFMYCSLMK